MASGLLRKLPQKGIFPGSLLTGIDPSQVGSKVFWFLPNSQYITLNNLSVSAWNDAFGLGHNILQAVAASQPLYLPLTIPTSGGNGNYCYLPGTNNGEYLSTPDSAALSITGDMDLRWLGALDNWASASVQVICSKWSSAAGQRSFLFTISAGVMKLQWSNDGTTINTATATAPVSYTGSQDGSLRVSLDVNNGSGVWEVNFYQSSDRSQTWQIVGSSVTGATTTTVFDSTTQVEIGSYASGTLNTMAGKVYNCNFRASLSGSPVASFNADKGNAYSSTLTANTGEVWTLTYVTTIGGYHIQLVDQPMVMFDGSNDQLKAVAFTFNQPCTIYIMLKQNSYTATDYIFDGNNTNLMGLTQAATDPNIRQNAGVNGTENGGFAKNTFRILTLIFNGASSLLQVDNTGTSITSNAGTNNPAGFTMGSRGDSSRFGNVTVLECIAYNAVHSAALQTSIRTDMASRHKYTLI